MGEDKTYVQTNELAFKNKFTVNLKIALQELPFLFSTQLNIRYEAFRNEIFPNKDHKNFFSSNFKKVNEYEKNINSSDFVPLLLITIPIHDFPEKFRFDVFVVIVILMTLSENFFIFLNEEKSPMYQRRRITQNLSNIENLFTKKKRRLYQQFYLFWLN